MGWFDDDDDDSDEEEQKRPRKIGLHDFTAETTTKNEKDDSEVEDPLDAYMKSLDTVAAKNSEIEASGASPTGGRLDVDNEEEATSHWDNTNTNSTTDAPDERTPKNGLQKNFLKASIQEGDVDIRLQTIAHDKIQYSKFQKCLLSTINESRNTPEGHQWRTEHRVTCQPPTLDPVYDFAELRDVLPQEVLEWNSAKNLTRPTPVQSQTMGVVLCGKDAIVTASTGSGKTLSYLWPIAAHLTQNSSSRSLVLVPTRELALQVEQIARSLFQKLPLRALAITGGNLGRYQLSQKLNSTKPQCVICTPGRLLDVLSAQQKSKADWLLPNITFLVLDEADKMIQMGFANQVTQIIQSLRPDRQSLLVSATFPASLQRKCSEWMHNPVRISVGRTGESSRHVLQHVICVPNIRAKTNFLLEKLPQLSGRTLVFCATRQGVEVLAADLRNVAKLETLHGDKHPTDRKAALKAFTKGDTNLLIATDVAGRGLDIPKVTTIVNYDPAKNWDTHVHRIGRAGRLSAKEQGQQEGVAYTLLLKSNTGFARSMVQAYKREGRSIPSDLETLANTSQSFGTKFGRPPSQSQQQQQQQQQTIDHDYYGPASKRSRFS